MLAFLDTNQCFRVAVEYRLMFSWTTSLAIVKCQRIINYVLRDCLWFFFIPLLTPSFHWLKVGEALAKPCMTDKLLTTNGGFEKRLNKVGYGSLNVHSKDCPD